MLTVVKCFFRLRAWSNSLIFVVLFALPGRRRKFGEAHRNEHVSIPLVTDSIGPSFDKKNRYFRDNYVHDAMVRGYNVHLLSSIGPNFDICELNIRVCLLVIASQYHEGSFDMIMTPTSLPKLFNLPGPPIRSHHAG